MRKLPAKTIQNPIRNPIFIIPASCQKPPSPSDGHPKTQHKTQEVGKTTAWMTKTANFDFQRSSPVQTRSVFITVHRAFSSFLGGREGAAARSLAYVQELCHIDVKPYTKLTPRNVANLMSVSDKHTLQGFPALHMRFCIMFVQRLQRQKSTASRRCLFARPHNILPACLAADTLTDEPSKATIFGGTRSRLQQFVRSFPSTYHGRGCRRAGFQFWG